MNSTDERIIVKREPLNAETPLALQNDVITEPGRHYVRSHFTFPTPPTEIAVDGLVAHPRAFTIADIRALPRHTLTITLECAGNGRAFLSPQAPGEQWRLGAAGTAAWTGARLADLLSAAGPLGGAREALFRGADRGTPDGQPREIAFERSLPLADALSDDVLLAHEMNGSPLPVEHGAPLRLVVPDRYGVASVKWLESIELVAEPFRGFYQAARYVIDGAPLGKMAPRAVIVEPADGSAVVGPDIEIRGLAWSGHGPVERVEVSADGGATWQNAALGPAASAHAWRTWRASLETSAGEHVLLARATDAAGNRQPQAAVWNTLGYGNNASQPIAVRVQSSRDRGTLAGGPGGRND